MISIIEFIKTDFGHVWPILLAGAGALIIIFERSWALFKAYPISNQSAYFDRIRELVLADEIGEAVALCDKKAHKPVAQVVKSALLRAHQPESLIENGLDLAVEDASQKLQKRTNFLVMISNVAVLLGLLGTILGLVTSFAAIGEVDADQKTSMLAKGISQALNATMLGLGVAIPAMVAFSFLMNRTNKMVSEVETAAVRILDIFKQRYFAAEGKVADHPSSQKRTGTHGQA